MLLLLLGLFPGYIRSPRRVPYPGGTGEILLNSAHFGQSGGWIRPNPGAELAEVNRFVGDQRRQHGGDRNQSPEGVGSERERDQRQKSDDCERAVGAERP